MWLLWDYKYAHSAATPVGSRLRTVVIHFLCPKETKRIHYAKCWNWFHFNSVGWQEMQKNLQFQLEYTLVKRSYINAHCTKNAKLVQWSLTCWTSHAKYSRLLHFWSHDIFCKRFVSVSCEMTWIHFFFVCLIFSLE